MQGTDSYANFENKNWKKNVFIVAYRVILRFYFSWLLLYCQMAILGNHSCDGVNVDLGHNCSQRSFLWFAILQNLSLPWNLYAIVSWLILLTSAPNVSSYNMMVSDPIFFTRTQNLIPDHCSVEMSTFLAWTVTHCLTFSSFARHQGFFCVWSEARTPSLTLPYSCARYLIFLPLHLSLCIILGG